MIGRVPQEDQILYQTERYDTATFGYDIPVYDDGWYLLVLKFSEVYFNAPNMKVIPSVLSLLEELGSLIDSVSMVFHRVFNRRGDIGKP